MSDASSRRGKVTPENRHESARLKALWNGYKADGGKSQAEFGHEYGIGSQSAVGNMLNGEQAISLKAAKGFALGLHCKISDFSPRLAAQIKEIASSEDAGWPFPGIDPKRFDALSKEQKIEIQGVVRERIEAFERPNGHRKAA